MLNAFSVIPYSPYSSHGVGAFFMRARRETCIITNEDSTLKQPPLYKLASESMVK